MYLVYLGNLLLPITPSKIEIKIKNRNETINLIDGNEINILKDPGLLEINFDVIIPHVKYIFAVYSDGFKESSYFLDKFKELKVNKKPFQFIVSRMANKNKILFDSNIKVSMEDYIIEEDAEKGQEVTVKIFLKQYKDYSTKTINIENNKEKEKTAFIETKRETSYAPKEKTYKVKENDTLWQIAKKLLGDGSKYKEIYELNKDKIKNPNLIKKDEILILPNR